MPENLLSSRFNQWPTADAAVDRAIHERARGIFQWVVLVAGQVIKVAKRGHTSVLLIQDVERLPEQLADLYRNILETLEQKERLTSARLFRWVIHSTRPLSLQELYHALLCDVGAPSPSKLRDDIFVALNEPHYNAVQMVKSLSCGLVQVVPLEKSELIVQVIHQSVIDFLNDGGFSLLDTTSAVSFDWTHEYLARSCIMYLSASDEMTGPDNPLYLYAACSWMKHATLAEEHGFLSKNLLSQLLINDNLSAVRRTICLKIFASSLIITTSSHTRQQWPMLLHNMGCFNWSVVA